MIRKVREMKRAQQIAAEVKPFSGPLDVTVVLLEAGHPSTAIGPIEVFHSAGHLWNWLHGEVSQPRFRVRTASIDKKPLPSLCGLAMQPEFTLDDIKKTDIIILSTADWNLQDQIAKNTVLLPWLRKWHARGAYIAGICTSVMFLAEAGLLDGKQATTHWGVAEVLRERYPNVLWKPEQFVTEDDRLLCSGGVYASIDLSLYLVEKFCGHEIALQSAKSLLLGMPRNRQSGYSVIPLARSHSDDKIKRTEEFLQQHYDRGISIDTLAERIGMSPRNFIRRFKSATGRLPGAYVQMLRVTAAKELLESHDMPIQNVSAKIGYEDIAFFRTLFKRHTGMTPIEYRNRFAQMRFDRGQLASNAANA